MFRAQVNNYHDHTDYITNADHHHYNDHYYRNSM
jgi:hypothetical protein